MLQKLTELVFIMDKSGSMSGLEGDTIGGFNAMIDKQKKLEGDVIVSTVLFNHETSVLHDRVNINQIEQLNNRTYFTGGMTALLDAVGGSIKHIRRVYADTLREERPDKVIFVITTDGLENSSRYYSYKDVKHMIQDVKDKYEWEFIFLGANIDAIDEARKIGIRQDRAADYRADKKGTKAHYEAINEFVSSVRMNNHVKSEWKQKIKDNPDEK